MPTRSLVLACALACVPVVLAQAQRGSLTGHVTDTLGTPIAGVTVHLSNTHYGTVTNGAGQYRLDGVTAGSYTVTLHRLGFAPDSFRVVITDSFVSGPETKLRSAAAELAGVTIVESSRLNETREAALAKRDQADNFIVVQSGDEIRALPNANAAEALARMPGVSTERDEGEGKFVQIRGTEPRLSNVTINGAHVPGTESSARIPKLDDVPSDLLGAVEVSETLTADQDADAIGGSVNLVSKIPDDVPRGYLAIQGGMQSQLNAKQGQWSLMYGGRYGEQRRLGALLGVTFDRNNRSIEDVEPAWDMSGARAFPVEWDQRDYLYGRTRTGAVGDLDYRFDGGSTLGIRGLFSEFHNYGTRYRFDAATGGDSTQAESGMSGVGTGATFVRETSQRRPNEQMYGLSMLGQLPSVPFSLSYGADFAGTRQLNKDYRTNDFEYDGPDGNGVPLHYDASSLITPRYQFVSASDSTAALDSKNYTMTKYSLSDGSAIGHDIGAHVDALEHYTLGTMPSTLKLGLKLRDETKSYVSRARTFAPIGSLPLEQFLSSYSDPSFYTTIASGFLMGPQAAEGAIESYENAHPEAFKDKTNFTKDSLASYSGSENVYSAYAMHTLDAGALHLNVGLRAEATHSDYTGHVATKTGSATAITTTPGSQDYIDLFPSVQVKYALSDRSDLRFAVTRGIARPNYIDLAPHLTGTVCASCQHSFGNLSSGNPDLKPQHAWNFDVLAERYLTRGGLLSGALFYKKISGFIYDREFVYDGPITDFEGYYGTRPENGGDATLEGSELTYTQRFYMLPGALSGLGLDVNWTHTNSRAQILADTATTAAGLGSPALARNTALPRQAPNVANLAATYDLGRISARAAYQYQGESIYQYGDGTATPNGDTYLYAHGQMDASLSIALTPAAQLQVQGLDLNNEVFGFYNGIPKARYNIQREVYGRSVIVGVKYGF